MKLTLFPFEVRRRPARTQPAPLTPAACLLLWQKSMATLCGLPSMLVGCLLLACPSPSRATTIVVPDDVPLIQAAIDLEPDTVLVLSGAYSERPAVSKDLVLIGVGPTKPLLDGLDVLIFEQQERIIVDGFHAKGLARLITYDEVTEFFAFRRCVFDSGFFQANSDVYDVQELEMRDCEITGALSIHADLYARFIGNVCRGPVRIHGSSGVFDAIIVDNMIRESMADNSIGLYIVVSGGTIAVRGNRIHGFGSGLFSQSFDRLEASGNRISDCTTNGLTLSGGSLVVSENVVQRCGSGMRISADALEITGNVVGRSTYDGIEVYGQFDGGRVANNTVYLSGRSGIRIEYFTPSPIQIDHNIGYQNGSFGLESVSPNATLSCNDWFGNAAGAVSPMGPGATDLAVDPQFCSIADDSVHLEASSPLIDAPGCGLIGARGVGCDRSTAVLVALFAVKASDNGVLIRWQLNGDEGTKLTWIERSEFGGPWHRVSTRRGHDDGIQVDRDDAAVPGHTYAYRLGWITSRGTTAWSSPASVTIAPAAARFELAPVAPQPSSGDVLIRFSLARDAAIKLEILDVQGRSIARLAGGPHRAGLHTVRWSGRGASGATPPGLYVVRYQHPEGQQSQSLLRVR